MRDRKKGGKNKGDLERWTITIFGTQIANNVHNIVHVNE